LAFHFFEQRGSYHGNDFADWLRAEREVVWRPHSEMFESDSRVVLRVAAPGFEERSIRLIAAPYALAVLATETHKHYGLQARLQFCEFGQRLFRLFELAARIDPKKVTATLERGILDVVATKSRRPATDRVEEPTAK
jgi:HSP20 family molecular chaperone IbpA